MRKHIYRIDRNTHTHTLVRRPHLAKDEGTIEPIFTVMMRNYCQNKPEEDQKQGSDRVEESIIQKHQIGSSMQFTLRVYLSIRSIVILSFFL